MEGDFHKHRLILNVDLKIANYKIHYFLLIS